MVLSHCMGAGNRTQVLLQEHQVLLTMSHLSSSFLIFFLRYDLGNLPRLALNSFCSIDSLLALAT